ncbi:hypothetical protein M0802_008858 [Mischocyttarus mexicanus]|nr:hypothetical protein M0802_008858 [Mischocyttarus mexicanus]
MSNFGEHRTSKRPRAIRTVKQAKQGRDIGYALVLKGCCITAYTRVQFLSGDNERRRDGVVGGGGGGGGVLDQRGGYLLRVEEFMQTFISLSLSIDWWAGNRLCVSVLLGSLFVGEERFPLGAMISTDTQFKPSDKRPPQATLGIEPSVDLFLPAFACSWLVGWLDGWLVGCLVAWRTDWLVRWLVVGWLVGCLSPVSCLLPSWSS